MIITKLTVSFLIVVFLLGIVEMVSANEPEMPTVNDVQIAPNAIGMPVGRILLVRKNNDYCAVKFTQNWTGKTDYDQHAEYESYYQGDQTGNLLNENVKYSKEAVYYTRPSFSIFGHPIRIGAKMDIRCGPIELWWSAGPYLVFVYYNKHDQSQRDHGIELAPTKWIDISQANVFDPRLKWLKFDENRKRVNVPLDNLW
jgi:hypothetical protein